MQYIEKFIIGNNLNVIIDYPERGEIKTVLVEKKIGNQVTKTFEESFDGRKRKVHFNEEYLILANKEFVLNEMDLKVITLNDGKEVTDDKMKIYEKINHKNRYGSFECIVDGKRR